MDWAALKAVYMAQPMTIANPATCSVRRSSVRRTCRILASSGETASRSRDDLDLLDARNPLQCGYAFGDRRVRVEEPAEEAAVVLVGVVDHHRGDRVVETLRRAVVLGDLLQRGNQSGRVPGQLHPADVGERLALAGERELHDRPDHERDHCEEDPDGENDNGTGASQAHPA